ncbi:hypothetical protein [Ekhidna sp.]
MKKSAFFVMTMLITCMTYGQEEDLNTAELKGHFLGLQVNELVRQIFSLGSTTAPSNPYFFNYNYTSATGKGFAASFAYSKDKFSNDDNFNTLTTNIDNISFRIGYEKKNLLSKRFVYSIGIDFLVESQKNETENEDNFSSQTIKTTNKTSGWGLGPRLNFQYRITSRVLIGTEANYYFKSLKEKFEIEFENNPDNNDESETDIKRLSFSSPAILWLTFRL